jgi:hypothetical protein
MENKNSSRPELQRILTIVAELTNNDIQISIQNNVIMEKARHLMK